MFGEYWRYLKEYYRGFKFWDFLVIFLVADINAGFVTALMVAAPISLWSLGWVGFSWLLWWLHINSVKYEIKNGLR